MADLVHGEDFFKFGDKVTFKSRSGNGGIYEYVEHLVVIGRGERMTHGSDGLRCASHDGAVYLIHPRMLDIGWNE